MKIVSTLLHFHQMANSGSDDNTIKVWDVATGQQINIGEVLRGHEDCVCSVAFSPDGTHIASGSGDNTIRDQGVGCSNRAAGW